MSSVLDLLINVSTLEELAENCNLSITGCLIYLKTLHIIYNGDLLREIFDNLENVRLCNYFDNLLKQMLYTRIILTEASACFIIWNSILLNKNPPFRLWVPYDLHENNTIYMITMISMTIVFITMSFLLITIGFLISFILIYFLECVLDMKKNMLTIGQQPNGSTHIEDMKFQIKKLLVQHTQLYE